MTEATSEVKAKKESTPREALITQNDVTRPKADTTTGRVWAIAEELSNSLGRPARRAEVVDACVEQGLNKATISTQYGRWTKFHGIIFEKAPKVEKAPEEKKAKKKKAKADAAPVEEVAEGESTSES